MQSVAFRPREARRKSPPALRTLVFNADYRPLSRRSLGLVGAAGLLEPGHHWPNFWVNTASRISGLADIRGKRIGVPDYDMTAALWFRITLKDLCGIDRDAVEVDALRLDGVVLQRLHPRIVGRGHCQSQGHDRLACRVGNTKFTSRACLSSPKTEGLHGRGVGCVAQCQSNAISSGN